MAQLMETPEMNLREKAYTGLGWSGFSGIVANGLELLKYIFMARILDPSDFGLLAMAMVIIGILKILSDGGTSNAVIHFDGQSNQALSTLFWINIIAGLVLFALLIASAPVVAIFYKQPEMRDIMVLASTILPVYAAGALYEVLLRKKLQFKYISVSEIFGALAGLFTAISLGLNGFGVYSLIWAHIVTAVIMTSAYIYFGCRQWKPELFFKPGDVREHLRFGLFQMGERGLNVYSSRIDQLIIGRAFGPEVLGAYHVAWQIILFPIIRLSPLLNRVAFPVFASKKNDNAFIRNGYIKLIKGISSIITPFLLIAGLSAPWLVPTLFGDGWDLAISFIPLMAAIAFFKMLGNPCGNIILAKGRARLAFMWTLFVSIVNSLLFIFTAQFSIFTLLWAYLLVMALYFFYGNHIMVNRIIDLKWRTFIQSVGPFFLTLMLPAAAVLILRLVFAGSAIQMLASIVFLFLLIYIPIVWYFFSDLIRDFIRSFSSTNNA